jgi:bacteriorhodopsin
MKKVKWLYIKFTVLVVMSIISIVAVYVLLSGILKPDQCVWIYWAIGASFALFILTQWAATRSEIKRMVELSKGKE